MYNRILQFVAAIGLGFVILLVLLTGLSSSALAADQCAAPSGSGGCFSTIQAAIDAAVSGDTVRVVAGTYVENIVIDKNLTLLGGFDAAPPGSSRTPRSSTIDGNSVGVVISITNNAVVTVDGFTISDGDGSTNNGAGGGIAIEKAEAIIRDNLIEDNVASRNAAISGAGGGIFVVTGTALIENNTIQRNVAYSVTTGSKAGYGGGICIADASSATIINNQILDNTAAQAALTGNGFGEGGGIEWWGEVITITGNTIKQNWGNAVSGEGYGGGISLWGQTSSVTNNLIQENRAARIAAFPWGGGIVAGNQLQFTLTDNQIISNTAVITGQSTASPQNVQVVGGGVVVYGQQPANDRLVMENNHLIGNVAAVKITVSGNNSTGIARGGAVWMRYLSSAQIISNEVRANMAVESLSLSSNGNWGGEASGGGMYLRGSDAVTVSDNRIMDNIAAQQQTMNETDSSSSTGGGLAFEDVKRAYVSGNTIDGNTAVVNGTHTSNSGLGYWPGGGGVDFECNNITGADCAVVLTANDILNNYAAHTLTLAGTNVDGSSNGSGFNINFGHATLNQNRFLGNQASGGGTDDPAVWAWDSVMTMTNNIVANNTGDGIGAGSGDEVSLVKIINNTVYNNRGDGIAANGGANTTVYVTNTIVYSHTHGFDRALADGATLISDYNLLFNTDNYEDAPPGVHDITNVDPQFVDVSADDFHLLDTSPAIGKGTSTGAPGVDFENDTRPQGCGIDIGADELTAQACPVHLPIVLK